MSANGDGDHDTLAAEEFDLLVIALDSARQQTEAGEQVIEWGPAVVRYINAVAERESEHFAPHFREDIERAVARGAAHALSTGLKLWFSPEMAR